MLFVSGDSQFFNLTHKVYEFFTESYEISSDVEIFATNLSNENALGFTEVNGDEQFVQVHNELTKEEHVKTILHELVHVCLLYTSPSPRDISGSRMPSSA